MPPWPATMIVLPSRNSGQAPRLAGNVGAGPEGSGVLLPPLPAASIPAAPAGLAAPATPAPPVPLAPPAPAGPIALAPAALPDGPGIGAPPATPPGIGAPPAIPPG